LAITSSEQKIVSFLLIINYLHIQ